MLYEKPAPVFTCNKCGHTASIENIEARRKQAAEEYQGKSGKKLNIDPVNENDTLKCPACDGCMSCSNNGRYASDEDDEITKVKKEIEKNLEKSLRNVLKRERSYLTPQELEKDVKRIMNAVVIETERI